MSMDETTNKSVIWGWAAAAGVVAFIIFMFLADYRFGPALLLAVLVAILVAILIWLAFFRGETTSADTNAPKSATAPAPASAPAASEPKPNVASNMMGDAGKSLKNAASEDYDGDGVVEGEDEGTKPAGLSGPRDGAADDLKKIKGVGPKLENLLNDMGFYHFDQIAGWSAAEVAWVNANLAGFKGRVTRDNWIEQATTLAAGGDTAFSKKVDKGGVY